MAKIRLLLAMFLLVVTGRSQTASAPDSVGQADLDSVKSLAESEILVSGLADYARLSEAFIQPITHLRASALAAPAVMAIWSNPITGMNPGMSNPYTIGDVVAPGITVSGIGQGSGITGANAANRYNARGWNTSGLDPVAFFTFTLTPTPGNEIDFSSFTYTGQASAGGPTMFAFRSSVDGFTTDIGTPTGTGTTISLTSAAYQNVSGPIEFRLYAWGAIAAPESYSINDFTFNGTISPIVPEPSVLGVFSTGLALVVRRRR